MATFTVTNFVDSDAGSFRQAIFDANTQAGMDEIIFDTSGVPSTITLTSGALNITDSVNILGLGANLLTVSGNNTSHIFNINDGGSDIIDVLISGLTLTHGTAISSGGAIFNADENLSLVDAVITGNTILPNKDDFYNGGSQHKGGGIYNHSGNLKIVNGIISDNRVEGGILDGNAAGGGIFNFSGNLEIRNSIIRGNQVEQGPLNDGSSNGGGIYNHSGNLTVTDSTISNNSAGNKLNSGYSIAQSDGGGIFNGSGNLTVSNSNITENTAFGGDDIERSSSNSGNGGGIFNDSGTLSVNHSSISGNQAQGGTTRRFRGYSGNGGGIYNRSGDVSVNDSIISGNSVQGGGVLGNNPGTGNGGGIFNSSGDLRVTNSTISNNTAKGGNGYRGRGANSYGGGISGEVTVTNSTISGNTAEGGLAAGCYDNLSNGNPRNGNSYGGGIWGSGEVFNSTITGNTAAGGIGGQCIYSNINIINGIGVGSGIANTDTITITSSIVAGNANADDIYGGFTSGGNNLIGIDPLLGLLQNNGGFTETHALLPGSPAIDAGSNPLGLLTDQRGSGLNRTVGSQTDIGAFEVQQPPSTSVPEPSSMFGLIGLVILGTGSLLRRKLQNKS